MSNSSSEEDISNMLFAYSGWAILGFVIGTSNLLIFLSIAAHKALRDEKEYILLMALALADTLNMFAYLSAGIYRLWVVFTGRLNSKVSMLWCLCMPHMLLWLFAEHLAQLMLVTISCDRLLLVCKPIYYIKRGRKYASRMVFAAYGTTLSIAIVTVVIVFVIRDSNPTVDARCFTSSFGILSFYNSYGPPLFAFASVLIFIAVAPAYIRHNKVSAQLNGQPVTKAKLENQRKLTRTLAISCCCTFTLFCLPYRFAYETWDWGYKKLSQSLWMVCMTNSLANMAIYQLRHTEMRAALKNLFIRKEMPSVLTLWPTNT